jgi:beta-glucosidase
LERGRRAALSLGFGLSSSAFAYSGLRLVRSTIALGETAEIEFDLTNTGGRTAEEVAQLYIGQRHGSAARPVRLLKGFERVTLTSGETRAMRFVLHAKDMHYWSDAARDWVQDETDIDIMVGGDSCGSLADVPAGNETMTVAGE